MSPSAKTKIGIEILQMNGQMDEEYLLLYIVLNVKLQYHIVM